MKKVNEKFKPGFSCTTQKLGNPWIVLVKPWLKTTDLEDENFFYLETMIYFHLIFFDKTDSQNFRF